jgi:ubiquilin
MNEALQNPAIVDMMIQQNPQLRAMGPQARQILQSPQFRQMMTNPQALQQMTQLSRSLGVGPFGAGGGGESSFPAPGVTNTTPAENRGTTEPQNTQMPVLNPFASLLGGGLGANPFAPPSNIASQPPPSSSESQTTASVTDDGATGQAVPLNPFAMLFNPAMMGQGQRGADASTDSTDPATNPFLPQNNPFLRDPAALNTMMQAMGGGNQTGANPYANPYTDLMNMFRGAGTAPPDNRPPEERYATQLRQLNEMGFFDFDRNVQALSRSGGDVSGALEWLFSQSS